MNPADARTFDVFISYKNSDGNGERTRDAEMAFALHDKLEQNGISAFCSTLSLTRLGQSAYKDAINDALDAAKVLVVVGTSLDNILSPWVKYEWGSFHDDLLTGRKSNGTLVSFTSGLDPNMLPRELRGYEAFLTEQNGEELIVEFIKSALDNKIEMGFAGTKLERKLGVIGPATRANLVNAEDPDPHSGSAKSKKKNGKKGIVAAVAAIAIVAAVGSGVVVYNNQKAAQEEQARIQAEQQAALEEQQRQQAEQEQLSSYTVRYLVKGSKKELKAELEEEGVTIGTTIKLTAPTFKNYTLQGDKTVKLTIAKNPGDNVVTFYYKKKETEAPTPTTPSSGDDGDSSSSPSSTEPSTPSTPSGGGSSSTPSKPSKPKTDNPIIDDL